MAVKKAETRIPQGFVASDLGQIAATADGKATLVSYYQSPVARDRKQKYVVLVTDATWQVEIATYKWQVLGVDTDTTEGVWEYTPSGTMTSLTLNVTLKRANGTVLGTISMTQTVVSPNEDLENLIRRSNTTHPIAAAPIASREVINDYLGLIHAVAPVNTEAVMNKLLFGVSYIASQTSNQATRDRLLNILRTTLEGGSAQAAAFYTQATPGAGICGIRPEMFVLTAIVMPSATNMLTVTPAPSLVFPATATDVTQWLTQLTASLTALNDESRIDLFNIMRFPKLSLKCSKLMFEALRARFSGRSFDALFGVQADILSLIDVYKTGPHI